MSARMSRRVFMQRAGALSAGVAIIGVADACSPSTRQSGSRSGPQGKMTVATTSLSGLGQDFLTVLVLPDKTWWNEVFDYPVAQDSSGTYIPGLATSWEASTDKLSWKFVIRAGVMFHNGDEMTAEDMAFSYNRLMFDPQSKHPLKAYASLVSSITASGDSLIVKTKQPQSEVPVWFAASDGVQSGSVMSKKYFEKVGPAAASAHPIGTGPYQFVRSNGEQSVQLTAFVSDNRNDWQKARTPAIKDLTVIGVPNGSTRVALLRSGGADIVPITYSDISTVKTSGNQVLTSAASTYAGMFFVGYTINPASPFNDVRVREALSVAIDRATIAKSLYGGTAEPSAAFYGGPHSIGYPSDLTPPPYDPNKAKQLLQAAGFNDRLQIVSTTDDTEFPGIAELAEAIAGYFSNIGLTATITHMDAASIKTNIYANKSLPGQANNPSVSPATLYLRGFDNTVQVLPDQIRGFTPASRPGASMWNYPEQVARLSAAAAEFDETKQAADIGDYDKWMATNWSQCPLLAASALFGVSKKMTAWKPITGKAWANNLESARF